MKKYPPYIIGCLFGFITWSTFVLLAWIIYQIDPEGKDAASFILSLMGFPSSFFFFDFNGSIFFHTVSFSIAGYLQWMLLGTLLGYITFIFRKNKKANYYDTKKRHYLLVYFLLLTLVIGILLLSTGMLYNIKQADLVGVILMVSSIILLKLQGWKYQKP